MGETKTASTAGDAEHPTQDPHQRQEAIYFPSANIDLDDRKKSDPSDDGVVPARDTSPAIDAAATAEGGPSQMAPHAPIHMEFLNRKSRKRKVRSAVSMETESSHTAFGIDTAEDDDDSGGQISESHKAPRQQQVLSEDQGDENMLGLLEERKETQNMENGRALPSNEHDGNVGSCVRDGTISIEDKQNNQVIASEQLRQEGAQQQDRHGPDILLDGRKDKTVNNALSSAGCSPIENNNDEGNRFQLGAVITEEHRSVIQERSEEQNFEEGSQQQQAEHQQEQQQQQQHESDMIAQHHHIGPQMEQPEGWRVKLYRLNIDGSWDDCGTGRIVCLYRSQQQQQQLQVQTPKKEEGNLNGSDKQPSSGPAPHQTTDQWLFQETEEATLCVQAELTKTNRQPRVLLRTRIMLRDAYQRQGDNIITWCEPFYGPVENNEMPGVGNNPNGNNDGNLLQQPGGGVDLALSFQDNAGCMDIWRQITHVQSRATELLRSLPNDESQDSVQRMAAAIAARHAAQLQQQQRVSLDDGGGAGLVDGVGRQHIPHQQLDNVPWGGGRILDNGSPGQGDYRMLDVHLPDPPTLANLGQIADSMAAIQNVQQRETAAILVAKDECSYLRNLLALFPSAEESNDYGKLATLAACVKTILLMNEPQILELIVAVAEMFEQVCSCLEYDPDLREKANHRWFLCERAKFRTVVAMDNAELVAAIHRSFRVNYIRDTLLRPTMDESSLSTLSSLQTFTHADVVKGVTMSPNGEEVSLTESYLVRVIRMLGVEIHEICVLEWLEVENANGNSLKEKKIQVNESHGERDSFTVVTEHPPGISGKWKQYLAPQDASLSSRKLRRRGCLEFLRELFNMVRLSLQQADRDDFFSVICTLDVELVGDCSVDKSQPSPNGQLESVTSTEKSDQVSSSAGMPPPSSPTSLLSLLGNILSDPNVDVSEKGSTLEIISGVAMHDPSFIRRHCIDYHTTRKQREKDSENDVTKVLAGRPDPNEQKQVIHITPPDDLLASLIFLLDITTDAGILLQTTEIMRIILDTDITGDNNSTLSGFKDDIEGVPPLQASGPHHDQHTHPSRASVPTNDQKQFFTLFYEHYMEWLIAPFQFSLLHPIRRIPETTLKNPTESKAIQEILLSLGNGVKQDDMYLQMVPFNALRASFAVELLSFCVRAHLYWMKFFLLKSRVLGSVLALLKPTGAHSGEESDRCLKLSALRFLRSILSVHDEFYHRHIIQHDLFAPVFAALRENPVGDNLVSSSIVEMCDYIHNENIRSLLEYIVTKHLTVENTGNGLPKLEDISSPYVTTLTTLREAYEAKGKCSTKQMQHIQGGLHAGQTSPGGSRYFPPSGSPQHTAPRVLSGKALEDQRKFQEADEEESYFESDDSGEFDKARSPDLLTKKSLITTTASPGSVSVPMAVDEVDTPASTNPSEGSVELHRTPRMFSLSQAPLLNHLEETSATKGHLQDKTLESPTSTDVQCFSEPQVTGSGDEMKTS